MDCFKKDRVLSALELFNRMPERITWKDVDHRYQLMDEQTAQLCGFDSADISCEGITDFDLKCDAADFAQEFQKVDKLVMQTKKEQSGMSFCNYAGGELKLLLGRVSPYFDDDGRVVGTQTISLDVTDCAMMRSAFSLFFADFKNLGFNQKMSQACYLFKTHYDDFGLTPRQSEILFLVIRGYTAKEIGKILGDLSYRTVENHREVIRLRMNCNTRSEMIAKALDAGLGTIIPKSLVSIPMASKVLHAKNNKINND